MKKIIFLFALFLISVPCFASDWFQLDEKNYIDLESVEQYKNQWGEIQHEKYSFWLKSLNDKSASFIDLEKLFKKKVWYQMTNFIVDCNQKTIGGANVVTYDVQKNVLYSYTPPSVDYAKIVPDSKGEMYYYFICKPKQFDKRYLSE